MVKWNNQNMQMLFHFGFLFFVKKTENNNIMLKWIGAFKRVTNGDCWQVYANANTYKMLKNK